MEATPSSSIHGMSSGRTPVVPMSSTLLRREAHQVLRLRSEVGAVDAVRAVPREDQQRWLDLFRPLENDLERLADEDLRLERNVGKLLRHHLRALQVRLAELEQSLVDDVVVQLFLLLELEDLRRLHRQHVLDVVEHDVVVLDVERAAHVERSAERLRELEGRAHRAIAVGRAVDADEESAARERRVIADDEHVLLDAAQTARDDATELAERLASESVRADRHEIVAASRGADDLRRRILLFRDDPPVVAESHVAASVGASVVARRAIRVEADQARKTAFATIDLLDDLLVVDALEELARERDARRFAALAELIEKAVGDELKALLDELVVHLALALDLFRRLELRGKTGLELAEANVVESRGVDVIAGDPAARLLTELDRALHGPIGVLRVVDGHKDFPIHASAVARGSGGNR